MTEEKSEFEKFSDLTTRLLSVSKEELNRREAEWKRQRKNKRKATNKSGKESEGKQK